MSNDTYINITNYNDLIERVENLEKQYEIKRNKELVRVFDWAKKVKLLNPIVIYYNNRIFCVLYRYRYKGGIRIWLKIVD